MELVIVALILFAALVACWLVLPGEAVEVVTSFETDPVSGLAAQQQLV